MVKMIFIILFVGLFVLSGCAQQAVDNGASGTLPTLSDSPGGEVKEFQMTAYYDDQGIWYSLKEINVNKGDRVRIKATNIKGMHNFVIDEYDLMQELPLDEEVIIEFVADKTGQFTYYCAYPGHKNKGQWGTLTVSE